MDEVEANGNSADRVIRDGDVVIKGLTPYLIVGAVGVRQEPHQVFQPRTVPRERLQFLVLDAGLAVYRGGESCPPREGRRLEDVLPKLRAKILAEESMLRRTGEWARLVGD
jgi:hypothetical protein